MNYTSLQPSSGLQFTERIFKQLCTLIGFGKDLASQLAL